MKLVCCLCVRGGAPWLWELHKRLRMHNCVFVVFVKAAGGEARPTLSECAQHQVHKIYLSNSSARPMFTKIDLCFQKPHLRIRQNLDMVFARQLPRPNLQAKVVFLIMG